MENIDTTTHKEQFKPQGSHGDSNEGEDHASPIPLSPSIGRTSKPSVQKSVIRLTSLKRKSGASPPSPTTDHLLHNMHTDMKCLREDFHSLSTSLLSSIHNLQSQFHEIRKDYNALKRELDDLQEQKKVDAILHQHLQTQVRDLVAQAKIDRELSTTSHGAIIQNMNNTHNQQLQSITNINNEIMKTNEFVTSVDKRTSLIITENEKKISADITHSDSTLKSLLNEMKKATATRFKLVEEVISEASITNKITALVEESMDKNTRDFLTGDDMMYFKEDIEAQVWGQLKSELKEELTAELKPTETTETLITPSEVEKIVTDQMIKFRKEVTITTLPLPPAPQSFASLLTTPFLASSSTSTTSAMNTPSPPLMSTPPRPTILQSNIKFGSLGSSRNAPKIGKCRSLRLPIDFGVNVAELKFKDLKNEFTKLTTSMGINGMIVRTQFTSKQMIRIQVENGNMETVINAFGGRDNFFTSACALDPAPNVDFNSLPPPNQQKIMEAVIKNVAGLLNTTKNTDLQDAILEGYDIIVRKGKVVNASDIAAGEKTIATSIREMAITLLASTTNKNST